MSYMIYRVVQFPTTFSDLWLRFQGHSASSICYAWLVFMQLTRDLFAIAKFLLSYATDISVKNALIDPAILTFDF